MSHTFTDFHFILSLLLMICGKVLLIPNCIQTNTVILYYTYYCIPVQIIDYTVVFSLTFVTQHKENRVIHQKVETSWHGGLQQ